MSNSPFPTLIRTAPGRWEGDNRTIQVLAVTGREGFTVTIGGVDTHCDNAEQVLAAIAPVPRVSGHYQRPKPFATHANWSTSGGIRIHRMPSGRSGRE